MFKTNTYFKNLLRHLSQIDNLTQVEKNNYWINEFSKFEILLQKHDMEILPEIMPLIYPDFLYNQNGFFIGHMIGYNSTFNTGINLSENCQFSSLQSDGICEFNNYKGIRGKCQADHFWPHSLGGPTIIENRVLLCKFHNVAKSNSVLISFWQTYPNWINNYLQRMYNLKS